MIHQKYVDEYIDLYESGKILLNKERVMLINYLKKYVLSNDNLYFDDKKIDNLIKFTEKWFFPTAAFQRFLDAFLFLYDSTTGTVYYDEFLIIMGRGAGKNGWISSTGAFLISDLNGIPGYNGSIVANSEEQAKTSIEEIYNVVGNNPILQNAFSAAKSYITSKATNSTLVYQTSNGKTKDGLRDGFDVFDEIHQYPDDSGVSVYESGLGKRPESRQFEIGSDGYVRGGYLDEKKKVALSVMSGKLPPDTMFPFWCKLDSADQVDDEKYWELANPMLSKPLTEYGQTLHNKMRKMYVKMQFETSKREEFMTKRMDFPIEDLERSIAPYEQIKATNKPIPDDLDGMEAIGSVDFASIRDFTADGLTIKRDGKQYFISHQFARRQFVDKFYAYSAKPQDRPQSAPPIAEWEERELLTVVDTPTIDPQAVVNWFLEQRKHYIIKKVVMDNFRADLLRKFFVDAGFEVVVIRNPTAIDGLLAPRIETGFANHQYIWGDNPLLRWNTQNVLVSTDSHGNKRYGKKEEIRRKTDGFKAFEYGQYLVDQLPDYSVNESLDMLADIDF
ncbi:terminase TerL endonuclease subunit [Lactiplantibacillus plantarum]|uniref:terminase TerL endonuclease subunit n=1 Tax=Lactiplantibacillus plantarum TaxID=1590 RepID=UPI001AAE8200|nr:terminase TerL endonuclease subunit [Lactiplantibacillus plantarum]MBO2724810.1 terminase large subunit [Lactiplantibacillus plantarum]